LSSISPKEFYDEFDNHYEIKKLLRKERYKKCFSCVYNILVTQNHSYVDTVMLQQTLCIPEQSIAYQILYSFVILNLLDKKKVSKRRTTLFFIKNKQWWIDFYEKEIKEVKEVDGSTKAD
jgi:hypothetical protein